MTGLTLFVVFIAVALVGWCVCEAIGKLHYTHAPEEQEGWEEFEEHAKANNGKKQNIRDIMRNNSTKGFSAVD